MLLLQCYNNFDLENTFFFFFFDQNGHNNITAITPACLVWVQLVFMLTGVNAFLLVGSAVSQSCNFCVEAAPVTAGAALTCVQQSSARCAGGG